MQEMTGKLKYGGRLIAIMGGLLLPNAVFAQEQRTETTAATTAPKPASDKSTSDKPSPEQSKGKPDGTVKKAGEIVTQPARDVGIDKQEIPQVLVDAAQYPYDVKGVKTCRQITTAVKELNEVLGADYQPDPVTKENRAGKLAEAGGKTVINAFIPFRGLVREITGAAPAQRRYNAALDAGLARRGFLRGLHQAHGCTTKL